MIPREREVNEDANDRKDAERFADPVIETYKRQIDRTLIRENLRLSVEERFLKLMEMQRFAEELRRAGREAQRRQKEPKS
ncbi:hypothetical protein [Pyrinomonas methylaliphatogenes]|jgi:hypothetical protein|uniref:Uncharacterized protein n=1 Tax=Pyrinomonas methylaliphatogenes TaxID=454194 RepID=A0A0B6WZW2_9BACT|nr:hypothetical protein [Pyrinomonas methylaliphatogenes]CDM66596.1 hypothetical protein PYK22_02628 [Pyrinomonas methylaliphatogenes]